MEGEFQDQGQLDQDLEDWFSPSGSQSIHGFFFDEEKQESIRIEDSAPEGARIATKQQRDQYLPWLRAISRQWSIWKVPYLCKLG